MTIQDAQKKLISVAEAEEGYLEKASNAQLDDKTANAGWNNYTKYARDHAKWGTYHAPKQGLAVSISFLVKPYILVFVSASDINPKLTAPFRISSKYVSGCFSYTAL